MVPWKSRLAHGRYSNDWGHLQYDSDIARALLQTGPAALPYLRPLLDDRSPFLAMGSMEATQSRADQYRRCDFAYRYICLILGSEPEFDRDPENRDKAIERLKAKLK